MYTYECAHRLHFMRNVFNASLPANMPFKDVSRDLTKCKHMLASQRGSQGGLAGGVCTHPWICAALAAGCDCAQLVGTGGTGVVAAWCCSSSRSESKVKALRRICDSDFYGAIGPHRE